MRKEQVLTKIAQAWATLEGSYSGLTAEQMVEPGVTESWSVKDILAHVTWWEEESLKYLPVILEGRRPPRYSTMYGGIDAFNALMTEQKRGLSLSEVLKQLQETHHRLVLYVESAPEEQLTADTSFRRRLRADTYGHYPQHAQAIRAWRERTALLGTIESS